MKFTDSIKQYYSRLIDIIEELDVNQIDASINEIMRAYRDKNKIYICGNGGSAATASHFANDFNKGVSEYVDNKFNFICLNDNIATIMAIANDIGYESVFSFQLQNRLEGGDILIAISGSGNSKNIIKAVEYTRSRGNKVIGISGYDGGKLYALSDFHMHAPAKDMQIVEDIHMSFDHMMMKIFYNNLVKKINSGDNL
jgi:D-sedoheptulose 7-phosphate isomerase